MNTEQLNETLAQRLAAENCGRQFIEAATRFAHLYDGDIQEFIRVVEMLEGEQERSDRREAQLPTNTHSWRRRAGNDDDSAGISDGQMQVEFDYDGDCLNYHGYALDTDRFLR